MTVPGLRGSTISKYASDRDNSDLTQTELSHYSAECQAEAIELEWTGATPLLVLQSEQRQDFVHRDETAKPHESLSPASAAPLNREEEPVTARHWGFIVLD